MKNFPTTFFFCTFLTLAMTSCDRSPQVDPELIVVDQSETDLRRKGVSNEKDLPSYPVSADEPVILEEILTRPADEVIAERSPAILESVLEAIINQSGDGTGTNPIELYGPGILGAILEGNAELPPEVIDEAKEAIVRSAPAVLEEILNPSGEENSIAGSIGVMLFRKIMESGQPAPTDPKARSHY